MNYLAILKTDNNEFVCLSQSKLKAKVGVYDAFNVHIKKILETQHKNPLQDVTSEWLNSRLEKFYRHYLEGEVDFATLEKKYEFQLLELTLDKVYKDGSEAPTREQDY